MKKKIFVNDYEITEQNTDRFLNVTKENYAIVDSDKLIEVIDNKALFTQMMGNNQRHTAISDYNLKTDVKVVFKTKKQDYDRFDKIVEIEKYLKAEYSCNYDNPITVTDLNPQFKYIITVHNRQRNNKTQSGGVLHRNLDRHLAKLDKSSNLHEIKQVLKLGYDDFVQYGNKVIYGTTARDIANQLKIMRDKN